MVMPPCTDTSQMPTSASTAAPMLNTVGRRCATIHHRKGTITQYVAVKNALMPGVVCSRPMVCVQNAMKSAKPKRCAGQQHAARQRLVHALAQNRRQQNARKREAEAQKPGRRQHRHHVVHAPQSCSPDTMGGHHNGGLIRPRRISLALFPIPIPCHSPSTPGIHSSREVKGEDNAFDFAG